MGTRVFVSTPGRCETHDAGLDDRRGSGIRKADVFRTRPIYSHGTAGKDTHSLTRGKLRRLSSSWRRRNVAIWSNDSRTRKARTCEGTDVPKSDRTFSRPKRAAMLVEARIHPTWIPVKMQTTYLQCGHRSICRVVYTHVKWPSIELGISSLRFLHCNAYLWARSNNFETSI
jgi:hypothetical protein